MRQKRKKPPIENKIYASIVGSCEDMEFKKIYKGNGHHLAQRLTTIISAGILPKEQKKIYDVLTKSPQTTKEIAEKVNMSTRVVSSQLKIYTTVHYLFLKRLRMKDVICGIVQIKYES